MDAKQRTSNIRVVWPFFIAINNFANREPVLRLVEPCLRQGQPFRLNRDTRAIASSPTFSADTLLIPEGTNSLLSPGKSTLIDRMWLTIVVGLQVFVAPILAFTATYILKIDAETYTFTLQIHLLPWIISAAMLYGIISLILGLAVGGYMPNRVAEAGGWWAILGLTTR